jgi:hypothetical protein
LYIDGRFRYDEVGNLYLEQLAYVWMEDSTTKATCDSVNQKIDNFAESGLGHATEIIVALLEIANKDEDIKSPANASFVVRSSFFPESR